VRTKGVVVESSTDAGVVAKKEVPGLNFVMAFMFFTYYLIWRNHQHLGDELEKKIKENKRKRLAISQECNPMPRRQQLLPEVRNHTSLSLW
jgi:hypothetical protein